MKTKPKNKVTAAQLLDPQFHEECMQIAEERAGSGRGCLGIIRVKNPSETKPEEETKEIL